MVVIWMLNAPIGISGQLLYKDAAQSGGWVNLSYETIANQISTGNIVLHIIAPVKSNKALEIGYNPNCTCHYIPWHSFEMGKMPSDSEQKRLASLFNSIAPDIIMVWGTEFAFSYAGLMYAHRNNIPGIIYVQGIVRSFLQFPNALLSIKQMKNKIGLWHMPKVLQFYKYIYQLKRQSLLEAEMFHKCDGIISDNQWCFENIRAVNTDVRIYKSLLPINGIFKQHTWDFGKIKPYRIFTVAGRTAYKGLHKIIEALIYVKRDYPSVQLVIPGNMGYGRPVLLKKPPYIVYIERLIKELHLEDNIILLGRLNHSEMVSEMLKSHCFVMPSCVENHSSTLREALFLGIPCISSLVGSIGEIIRNEIDGLLYRYDDTIALACAIKKIFISPEQTIAISRNGRQNIREFYSSPDSMNIENIYEQVIRK